MSVDFKNDPYTWEGLTGWRSYRVAHPFRGMYWDIRRRLPYYWSDIKDGFTYRTFAGTIRIFFVNLLPALAFQLDMTRNTGGYFGINEALFSSALAAVVFSTLSCQPLTVVGITGLISLFNYTIYDITVAQGMQAQYPQIIAWVSIWAAITHWIASIFNLCDYMRYITDFSSTSFGAYVSIIYMSMWKHPSQSLWPDNTDTRDSQGRGGARQPIRRRQPGRWLPQRRHRTVLLVHHLRPRAHGLDHLLPAFHPEAVVGLRLPNRHHLLDRLLPHPRPHQKHRPTTRTSHPSLLPNRGSKLARRLLDV